jgi:hypothetical protein
MIKYDMPYEMDALQKIIDYNNEYRSSYPNNYIVEIGCSNNSWLLNDPLSNLRGIRIDADMYKILGYGSSIFPVKSINRKVSASNICAILEENNVPNDFFMLSIDIDGPDFFVLLAILKKYKPKVIITEINEVIPYPVKFAIKANDNFKWTGGYIYGYSVACLEDVMKIFNYNIDDLIMNNAFLVRNDTNVSPNINKVNDFYTNGYLYNTKYPRTDMSLFINEYNADLQYLHNIESKEDIANAFRQHFIDNPINRYNGLSTINNIDNYVINDEYEKYLNDFLKK